MAVIIVWIAIAIRKIPPVHVIHKPVAVIIYTIAGHLARIRPEPAMQILVLEVNASVNHCHNHGPGRHHTTAVQ